MKENNMENSMELLRRYLYAIKTKLPIKSRDDLIKEIESLTMDELEDRFGPQKEYTEEEIKTIIKEMGSPRRVASRYRGDEPYLIGPELSEIYRLVLLIASGAVTLGLMISFVIGSFSIDNSLGKHFLEFLRFFPSLFSALLSMVGSVTIIFALIQKFGNFKPEDLEIDEDWTYKDLPELPQKEEIVKLWEPIVGLFFTFLALILLNGLVYGNLHERLINGSGACTIIPIINLSALRHYAPLWNISLLLGLIGQVLLIVLGKREWRSRILELFTNLFDITILAIMIKGPMMIVPRALTAAFNPPAGSSLANFILNADRYYDLALTVLIIISAVGMIINTVKFILSRVNP
jgi:hypothetical protein